jgi:hypothetical protein
VLETDRRGVPARLYYCLNLQRLVTLLLQHGQALSVADHGPKLEADHGPQLDTDHGPQLDTDHGPQLDAGDGQRQEADHGPHHNKIIEENIQESTRKIFPSPSQDTEPPRKKPGRQSTPKHPLPENFVVTPAMRTWAAERAPAVDLDFETEKLVMWATAKGVWRSDWVAAWRSWMLNAAKPGLRGQRRAASPRERHAGIQRWLDQKREP